jgi:hypothetical protein
MTTEQEVTDAMKFMISKDIEYYKQQISDSKWALNKPDYESNDDYLCRCDSVRNYHEKRSDLKYKYGIEFEGED